MDRRRFFAAFGGFVVSGVAAKAQTAGVPIIGDILTIPGAVVGTGVGVVGGTVGGVTDLVPKLPGAGFRLAALQNGDYAIEASRLVLETSGNRSIRDFAQLEINEQTAIAATLFATPGSVPPRPDQQAIIASLAATRPGPRLDRRYVLGQINAHREALKLSTFYAQNGLDPRAQAVAVASIPTIQTHLAILYRLRVGIPAV